MRAKLAEHEQLTVEEFLAFTETRPDGERWELIEGIAVMSPSPTDFHQIIVGNLVTLLNNIRRTKNSAWIPLPGVGTLVPVSPRSLPQPDVMVKSRAPQGTPISDEALVLFEVMSKSNSRKDQAWRKRVYASVPNCQHYVTVLQRRALVVRYDRANGWEPLELGRLTDVLELPALGAALPLSEIYDGTTVAANDPA